MRYAFDSDFTGQLQQKLEMLVFTQHLRCRLYGANIAEESPISHTPPEVKEQYKMGQEAAYEDWDAPTPENEEEGWYQPGSKYGLGHTILDTPPSDNSSQTSWGSVPAEDKPIAPMTAALSLRTPPASFHDASSIICRKTATTTASAHFGTASRNLCAGMKRSFAQLAADRLEEPRLCRRSRIIIPTRRIALSMG
jgi:hypothetical protein